MEVEVEVAAEVAVELELEVAVEVAAEVAVEGRWRWRRGVAPVLRPLPPLALGEHSLERTPVHLDRHVLHRHPSLHLDC